MKSFYCDVSLTDHVAMSCMHDRLKQAVNKTCSKEPDSFGDQLFCKSLRWSWLKREQAVTVGFLEEVAVLLNKFESEAYEASVLETGFDFLACRVYRITDEPQNLTLSLANQS
jgi:hypothetical protein